MNSIKVSGSDKANNTTPNKLDEKIDSANQVGIANHHTVKVMSVDPSITKKPTFKTFYSSASERSITKISDFTKAINSNVKSWIERLATKDNISELNNKYKFQLLEWALLEKDSAILEIMFPNNESLPEDINIVIEDLSKQNKFNFLVWALKNDRLDILKKILPNDVLLSNVASICYIGEISVDVRNLICDLITEASNKEKALIAAIKLLSTDEKVHPYSFLTPQRTDNSRIDSIIKYLKENNFSIRNTIIESIKKMIFQ